MRILLLLIASLIAAPASAAERRLFIASFARLRVEGPIRVVVTTGLPPAGAVVGDAAQLQSVEVRQDDETVVVQLAQDGVRSSVGAPPVTVRLATPALAAANLVGAGEVSVTAMKAPRIDLSVAGAGAITVGLVEAPEVAAASIGDGRLTLAGHAVRARLIVSGAGAIKADGLEAGDLIVRLDGPGLIDARARYTAAVSNTGLGQVTVAGNPKCTVGGAGGAVSCGSGPAR